MLHAHKKQIKAHIKQAKEHRLHPQRDGIGPAGDGHDYRIDHLIESVHAEKQHKGVENVQKESDHSLLGEHHPAVIFPGDGG